MIILKIEWDEEFLRICIVGGGFTGLLAAYKLCKCGCNPVVFEEHDRVGYPMHCTGIVSERVVEWIGVIAREYVLNVYDTVEVRNSLGESFSVECKPKALLLDRVGIEEGLLKELVESGVDVKLKCRVERVSAHGVVEAGGSNEEYSHVIIADGYYGAASRLYRRGLCCKVNGVNTVVETTSVLKENTFITGFNHKVAPGFFYWIAPRDSRTAIVGFGFKGKANALDRVREICKLHNISVKRIRKVYGGAILTGPPEDPIVSSRVTLAGDAACMSKPVTGGGLFASSYTFRNLPGKCRAALVEVRRRLLEVKSVLEKQVPIARILQDEENQEFIDEVINILSRAGKLRVDYDYHTDLVLKVLSKPASTLKILYVAYRRGVLGSIFKAGVKALL